MNSDLGVTTLSESMASIAAKLGIKAVTREGNVDHDRFVRVIEQHYQEIEDMLGALTKRADELSQRDKDLAQREADVSRREASVDAVERLVTLKGKVKKFSFWR